MILSYEGTSAPVALLTKGQESNAHVMSPLSSIPALYCSDHQW